MKRLAAAPQSDLAVAAAAALGGAVDTEAESLTNALCAAQNLSPWEVSALAAHTRQARAALLHQGVTLRDALLDEFPAIAPLLTVLCSLSWSNNSDDGDGSDAIEVQAELVARHGVAPAAAALAPHLSAAALARPLRTPVSMLRVLSTLSVTAATVTVPEALESFFSRRDVDEGHARTAEVALWRAARAAFPLRNSNTAAAALRLESQPNAQSNSPRSAAAVEPSDAAVDGRSAAASTAMVAAELLSPADTLPCQAELAAVADAVTAAAARGAPAAAAVAAAAAGAEGTGPRVDVSLASVVASQRLLARCVANATAAAVPADGAVDTGAGGFAELRAPDVAAAVQYAATAAAGARGAALLAALAPVPAAATLAELARPGFRPVSRDARRAASAGAGAAEGAAALPPAAAAAAEAEGALRRQHARLLVQQTAAAAAVATGDDPAVAAAFAGAAAGAGASAAATGGALGSAESDETTHGGTRRGRGTTASGRPAMTKYVTESSDANTYMCTECGGGERAELMLLCDGCDRGYHMYCLTPPLHAMPTTPTWFCQACVDAQQRSFGYNAGRVFSLRAYQRHADKFRFDWHTKLRMTTGRLAVPLPPHLVRPRALVAASGVASAEREEHVSAEFFATLGRRQRNLVASELAERRRLGLLAQHDLRKPAVARLLSLAHSQQQEQLRQQQQQQGESGGGAVPAPGVPPVPRESESSAVLRSWAAASVAASRAAVPGHVLADAGADATTNANTNANSNNSSASASASFSSGASSASARMRAGGNGSDAVVSAELDGWTPAWGGLSPFHPAYSSFTPFLCSPATVAHARAGAEHASVVAAAKAAAKTESNNNNDGCSSYGSSNKIEGAAMHDCASASSAAATAAATATANAALTAAAPAPAPVPGAARPRPPRVAPQPMWGLESPAHALPTPLPRTPLGAILGGSIHHYLGREGAHTAAAVTSPGVAAALGLAAPRAPAAVKAALRAGAAVPGAGAGNYAQAGDDDSGLPSLEALWTFGSADRSVLSEGERDVIEHDWRYRVHTDNAAQRSKRNSQNKGNAKNVMPVAALPATCGDVYYPVPPAAVKSGRNSAMVDGANDNCSDDDDDDNNAPVTPETTAQSAAYLSALSLFANLRVSPLDTASAFWALLNKSRAAGHTGPLNIEYGSDVDSDVVGSVLPDLPVYRQARFNPRNIGLNSASALRHLSSKMVGGITVPWYYVGMMFSTFAWHIEDHNCNALNYLHCGAPKHWYALSAEGARVLEERCTVSLAGMIAQQPDLLFQLVTMVDPALLTDPALWAAEGARGAGAVPDGEPELRQEYADIARRVLDKWRDDEDPDGSDDDKSDADSDSDPESEDSDDGDAGATVKQEQMTDNDASAASASASVRSASSRSKSAAAKSSATQASSATDTVVVATAAKNASEEKSVSGNGLGESGPLSSFAHEFPRGTNIYLLLAAVLSPGVAARVARSGVVAAAHALDALGTMDTARDGNDPNSNPALQLRYNSASYGDNGHLRDDTKSEHVGKIEHGSSHKSAKSEDKSGRKSARKLKNEGKKSKREEKPRRSADDVFGDSLPTAPTRAAQSSSGTALPPRAVRARFASAFYPPRSLVHQVIHYPGEIVVTFPQAYHAGFNHGFNIAESVNFAPLEWLPYGLRMVEKYAFFRRAPVFSHDRLVCHIAAGADLSGLPAESLCAVYVCVRRVFAHQRALRRHLLKAGMRESLPWARDAAHDAAADARALADALAHDVSARVAGDDRVMTRAAPPPVAEAVRRAAATAVAVGAATTHVFRHPLVSAALGDAATAALTSSNPTVGMAQPDISAATAAAAIGGTGVSSFDALLADPAARAAVEGATRAVAAAAARALQAGASAGAEAERAAAAAALATTPMELPCYRAEVLRAVHLPPPPPAPTLHTDPTAFCASAGAGAGAGRQNRKAILEAQSQEQLLQQEQELLMQQPTAPSAVQARTHRMRLDMQEQLMRLQRGPTPLSGSDFARALLLVDLSTAAAVAASPSSGSASASSSGGPQKRRTKRGRPRRPLSDSASVEATLASVPAGVPLTQSALTARASQVATKPVARPLALALLSASLGSGSNGNGGAGNLTAMSSTNSASAHANSNGDARLGALSAMELCLSRLPLLRSEATVTACAAAANFSPSLSAIPELAAAAAAEAAETEAADSGTPGVAAAVNAARLRGLSTAAARVEALHEAAAQRRQTERHRGVRLALMENLATASHAASQLAARGLADDAALAEEATRAWNEALQTQDTARAAQVASTLAAPGVVVAAPLATATTLLAPSLHLAAGVAVNGHLVPPAPQAPEAEPGATGADSGVTVAPGGKMGKMGSVGVPAGMAAGMGMTGGKMGGVAGVVPVVSVTGKKAVGKMGGGGGSGGSGGDGTAAPVYGIVDDMETLATVSDAAVTVSVTAVPAALTACAEAAQRDDDAVRDAAARVAAAAAALRGDSVGDATRRGPSSFNMTSFSSVDLTLSDDDDDDNTNPQITDVYDNDNKLTGGTNKLSSALSAFSNKTSPVDNQGKSLGASPTAGGGCAKPAKGGGRWPKSPASATSLALSLELAPSGSGGPGPLLVSPSALASTTGVALAYAGDQHGNADIHLATALTKMAPGATALYGFNDDQCAICKAAVHVAAVRCACSPGKLACLYHAAELCGCPPAEQFLLYRYSERELSALVQRARAAALAACAAEAAADFELDARSDDDGNDGNADSDDDDDDGDPHYVAYSARPVLSAADLVALSMETDKNSKGKASNTADSKSIALLRSFVSPPSLSASAATGAAGALRLAVEPALRPSARALARLHRVWGRARDPQDPALGSHCGSDSGSDRGTARRGSGRKRRGTAAKRRGLKAARVPARLSVFAHHCTRAEAVFTDSYRWATAHIPPPVAGAVRALPAFDTATVAAAETGDVVDVTASSNDLSSKKATDDKMMAAADRSSVSVAQHALVNPAAALAEVATSAVHARGSVRAPTVGERYTALLHALLSSAAVVAPPVTATSANSLALALLPSGAAAVAADGGVSAEERERAVRTARTLHLRAHGIFRSSWSWSPLRWPPGAWVLAPALELGARPRVLPSPAGFSVITHIADGMLGLRALREDDSETGLNVSNSVANAAYEKVVDIGGDLMRLAAARRYARCLPALRSAIARLHANELSNNNSGDADGSSAGVKAEKALDAMTVRVAASVARAVHFAEHEQTLGENGAASAVSAARLWGAVSNQLGKAVAVTQWAGARALYRDAVPAGPIPTPRHSRKHAASATASADGAAARVLRALLAGLDARPTAAAAAVSRAPAVVAIVNAAPAPTLAPRGSGGGFAEAVYEFMPLTAGDAAARALQYAAPAHWTARAHGTSDVADASKSNVAPNVSALSASALVAPVVGAALAFAMDDIAYGIGVPLLLASAPDTTTIKPAKSSQQQQAEFVPSARFGVEADVGAPRVIRGFSRGSHVAAGGYVCASSELYTQDWVRFTSSAVTSVNVVPVTRSVQLRLVGVAPVVLSAMRPQLSGLTHASIAEVGAGAGAALSARAAQGAGGGESGSDNNDNEDDDDDDDGEENKDNKTGLPKSKNNKMNLVSRLPGQQHGHGRHRGRARRAGGFSRPVLQQSELECMAAIVPSLDYPATAAASVFGSTGLRAHSDSATSASTASAAVAGNGAAAATGAAADDADEDIFSAPVLVSEKDTLRRPGGTGLPPPAALYLSALNAGPARLGRHVLRRVLGLSAREERLRDLPALPTAVVPPLFPVLSAAATADDVSATTAAANAMLLLNIKAKAQKNAAPPPTLAAADPYPAVALACAGPSAAADAVLTWRVFARHMDGNTGAGESTHGNAVHGDGNDDDRDELGDADDEADADGDDADVKLDTDNAAASASFTTSNSSSSSGSGSGSARLASRAAGRAVGVWLHELTALPAMPRSTVALPPSAKRPSTVGRGRPVKNVAVVKRVSPSADALIALARTMGHCDEPAPARNGVANGSLVSACAAGKCSKVGGAARALPRPAEYIRDIAGRRRRVRPASAHVAAPVAVESENDGSVSKDGDETNAEIKPVVKRRRKGFSHKTKTERLAVSAAAEASAAAAAAAVETATAAAEVAAARLASPLALPPRVRLQAGLKSTRTQLAVFSTLPTAKPAVPPTPATTAIRLGAESDDSSSDEHSEDDASQRRLVARFTERSAATTTALRHPADIASHPNERTMQAELNRKSYHATNSIRGIFAPILGGVVTARLNRDAVHLAARVEARHAACLTGQLVPASNNNSNKDNKGNSSSSSASASAAVKSEESKDDSVLGRALVAAPVEDRALPADASTAPYAGVVVAAHAPLMPMPHHLLAHTAADAEAFGLTLLRWRALAARTLRAAHALRTGPGAARALRLMGLWGGAVGRRSAAPPALHVQVCSRRVTGAEELPAVSGSGVSAAHAASLCPSVRLVLAEAMAGADAAVARLREAVTAHKALRAEHKTLRTQARRLRRLRRASRRRALQTGNVAAEVADENGDPATTASAGRVNSVIDPCVVSGRASLALSLVRLLQPAMRAGGTVADAVLALRDAATHTAAGRAGDAHRVAARAAAAAELSSRLAPPPPTDTYTAAGATSPAIGRTDAVAARLEHEWDGEMPLAPVQMLVASARLFEPVLGARGVCADAAAMPQHPVPLQQSTPAPGTAAAITNEARRRAAGAVPAATPSPFLSALAQLRSLSRSLSVPLAGLASLEASAATHARATLLNPESSVAQALELVDAAAQTASSAIDVVSRAIRGVREPGIAPVLASGVQSAGPVVATMLMLSTLGHLQFANDATQQFFDACFAHASLHGPCLSPLNAHALLRETPAAVRRNAGARGVVAPLDAQGLLPTLGDIALTVAAAQQHPLIHVPVALPPASAGEDATEASALAACHNARAFAQCVWWAAPSYAQSVAAADAAAAGFAPDSSPAAAVSISSPLAAQVLLWPAAAGQCVHASARDADAINAPQGTPLGVAPAPYAFAGYERLLRDATAGEAGLPHPALAGGVLSQQQLARLHPEEHATAEQRQKRRNESAGAQLSRLLSAGGGFASPALEARCDALAAAGHAAPPMLRVLQSPWALTPTPPLAALDSAQWARLSLAVNNARAPGGTVVSAMTTARAFTDALRAVCTAVTLGAALPTVDLPALAAQLTKRADDHAARRCARGTRRQRKAAQRAAKRAAAAEKGDSSAGELVPKAELAAATALHAEMVQRVHSGFASLQRHAPAMVTVDTITTGTRLHARVRGMRGAALRRTIAAPLYSRVSLSLREEITLPFNAEDEDPALLFSDSDDSGDSDFEDGENSSAENASVNGDDYFDDGDESDEETQRRATATAAAQAESSETDAATAGGLDMLAVLSAAHGRLQVLAALPTLSDLTELSAHLFLLPVTLRAGSAAGEAATDSMSLAERTLRVLRAYLYVALRFSLTHLAINSGCFQRAPQIVPGYEFPVPQPPMLGAEAAEAALAQLQLGPMQQFPEQEGVATLDLAAHLNGFSESCRILWKELKEIVDGVDPDTGATI